MKKIIKTFFLFILLQSCSFDNKTGIWENAEKSFSKKVDTSLYENIEVLFKDEQLFFDELDPPKTFNFQIGEPKIVTNWLSEFQNSNNNLSNIALNNNKIVDFKSTKLTRNKINKNIFYKENNIIFSDQKGFIYVYSINEKNIIFKYNFYKKKFKKYKKEIYLTIKGNKIFATDNLGYIYCLDYFLNKVIWAKNYGIPFRSNIQLIGKQLFIANNDSQIASINVENGEKNWNYETVVSLIKTDFKNNISADKFNNLFFLNTGGTLYSFNLIENRVSWIVNLINTSKIKSNLFFANSVVVDADKLLISSDNFISLHNSKSGFKYWQKPVSSSSKPVISNELIYIISKKELLICIETKSGNIIWSKNIKNIKNVKKIPKNIKKISKIDQIEEIYIINNKLYLFSKNGFMVNVNHKNGSVISVDKITKLKSKPIFVGGSLYFINSKNKLIRFN